MDFTIKTYKQLLKALQQQDFPFQSFQEYLERPTQPQPKPVRLCHPGGRLASLYPLDKSLQALEGKDRPTISLMSESSPSGDRGARASNDKTIILRHDVDKLPENSLLFAQIQHELGINGSYYFRMVPGSFNPAIIETIANLGHEIGYHYEDIDLASKRINKQGTRNKEQETSLAELAIELFDMHLKELRRFYPVKTICMHGSPLSKYDNKIIWKYYNYKDYGIIGEPYFDVDFSNVLYLTDTGRRWDGERVSIRDKIKDIPIAIGSEKIKVKKTQDIIQAANNGKLPYQIMFTFHPQRWTHKPFPWVKELVLQNVKNLMKYGLNRLK